MWIYLSFAETCSGKKWILATGLVDGDAEKQERNEEVTQIILLGSSFHFLDLFHSFIYRLLCTCYVPLKEQMNILANIYFAAQN